jgi:Putative zinc-finger of transcription factor IIIC complex
VAHLLTRKLPNSLLFCCLNYTGGTAGDELPFVLRVAIQCMLQGIPQELSTEAQTLANKVTTSFPPIEHQGVSGGLEELCPACGVEVPLTDIAVAVCSNGHKWCESLMILDTPPRYADGPPIPRRAVSAMPSSFISSLFCHVVYSLDYDGTNVCRLCTESISPYYSTSVSTGPERGTYSGRGSYRANRNKYGWGVRC